MSPTLSSRTSSVKGLSTPDYCEIWKTEAFDLEIGKGVGKRRRNTDHYDTPLELINGHAPLDSLSAISHIWLYQSISEMVRKQSQEIWVVFFLKNFEMVQRKYHAFFVTLTIAYQQTFCCTEKAFTSSFSRSLYSTASQVIEYDGRHMKSYFTKVTSVCYEHEEDLKSSWTKENTWKNKQTSLTTLKERVVL